MAGDWFPMQFWRSKCPEVVAVAAATGRPRHEVLGLLCDLWSWASCESVGGGLTGAKLGHLADILGADERFWRAVVDANWLAEDARGLVIPNWDVWLSESAKKRHKDALRKRRSRKAASAKRPQNVRAAADKSHATGQDITEEKNKGEESPLTPSCPEPAPPPSGPVAAVAPADPPVLTYPTAGPVREWHLTAAKVAELAAAFPALDVTAECRKALAWVLASPDRRKTPRGMGRFLFGWMGRAQDRGGRGGGGLFKTKGEAQAEYSARVLINGLAGRGEGDEPGF